MAERIGHDTPTRGPERRGFRFGCCPPRLALGLFLFCLGLAALGWHSASNLTDKLARERFEARAGEIVLAIEDRLATYEMALRGGQALFASVRQVGRQHWRDYIGKLNIQQNYPGIQGMGYSHVVRPEDLDRHQEEIRALGFPEYAVRPPGQRDTYTAILYLEPFDARNQRAFGFDMFSEPVRRAAMERARDSGDPAASGRVTLVQETETGVQAGFLVYLPCYAPGAPVFTVEERRAALRGYVYSPFRMNNLMRGILGKSIPGLGVELFDGKTASEEALLFRSEGQAAQRGSGRAVLYRSQREVMTFGQPWTLVFHSLPDFEATVDRTVPRMVLGGGVAISLLLALIAHSLLTTRARALSLAEAMTLELRESEERTRLILESTDEPIYGIDTEGRCTFCNPACLRTLGYARPEDLLGRNMHELIHHTRADGAPFPVEDCRIYRAFQKGAGTHVDDEALWRADGTSFPAEYWSYPQRRDGQIVGAVVVFQDITERRKAEADSAKLAGLVNAASQVSIIATDIEGLITVFNHGAENMLGYAAEEMVGRRTPEAIHLAGEVQEHGQRLTEQLGRPVEGFEVFVAMARQGGYEVRQWTYVRKDGRQVPVELVVTAIKDRDGGLMGFLGIGVDISARVQAEAALRESEGRLSAVLENAVDAIFTVGEFGHIRSANAAACRTFGYTQEELVGRNVKMLMPEPYHGNHDGYLARYRSTGVPRILGKGGREVQGRRKDGAIIPLELSVSGMVIGGEHLFTGILRDISDRVQARRELEEANAALAKGENFLKSITNNIPGLVGYWNAELRCEFANQAYQEWFGRAPSEIVGMSMPDLLGPELFAKNEKHVRAALRGEAQYFERELTKAGGNVRSTLTYYIPDGTLPSVRGFFVLVSDVTELKETQMALEERQRHLEADLEAAAEIQRSLLPKEGTCSLGLESDFRFMPSASIGGDIFNVVCLGPHHTGLYMVDVSGHGVPAALVSVSVAQELAPSGGLLMDKFFGQPRSPEGVLRLLDDAFPMERFDKFFSMFYMLYETRSGALAYCNAGHPAPMLLRADGRTELLEAGGTLVGMGLGHTYEGGRLDVGDGDLLLVYTDGVSELENLAGKQFGEDMLWESFSECVGRAPREVLDLIVGRLQAHADGRPPDDDISIICVRFSKT